jgi:hypothetical protein
VPTIINCHLQYLWLNYSYLYYVLYSRLILKVKGPGVNRGIQFSDGANTYPYGACSGGHRDTWEVKIPNHVSCDHCILQVHFVDL